MAKGRHNRKRSSTSTLVLSMLLMLTLVLLLLLALGILSLPASSDHLRPAHDLSSFGRKVLERFFLFLQWVLPIFIFLGLILFFLDDLLLGFD